MAFSAPFRSYSAFKVELYCKYLKSISINSWSNIIKKKIIIIIEDLVIKLNLIFEYSFTLNPDVAEMQYQIML